MLLVTVVGAAFAGYWFYFRKKKPQVGTLAQQAQPTYSPPQYTTTKTAPVGIPRATKVSSGQQFLNQMSGQVAQAATQQAQKLAGEAASKLGAAGAEAIGNLFSSWSN